MIWLIQVSGFNNHHRGALSVPKKKNARCNAKNFAGYLEFFVAFEFF